MALCTGYCKHGGVRASERGDWLIRVKLRAIKIMNEDSAESDRNAFYLDPLKAGNMHQMRGAVTAAVPGECIHIIRGNGAPVWTDGALHYLLSGALALAVFICLPEWDTRLVCVCVCVCVCE